MTFDRIINRLRIVAFLLVLTACNGDNSIEDGLVAHLAEVHVSGLELANETGVATGGYDHAALEKHPIRDATGPTLWLYRAHLVIDGVELVPCTSLTRLPLTHLPALLLAGVFPAAHAHAGHGTEPVGGRSLDQPNVIDIVTQEGFILPLGDRAIAPGRYCGVRVALVRLAGEAYGKPEPAQASNDDPTTVPEVPEMSGRMFALRADYCAGFTAGQCTGRIKVDVDDGGLPEPAPVTLSFNQPLEVNSVLREVYVAVGISHGTWVQDIDITLLNTDPDERQKLLDNIVASFHVYDAGFGELPPNIIQ